MAKVPAPAILQMHQELMAESNLNSNYIVLVITSCLIATFGLLSNSTAVIIGAMLVAPLMLPLRGLAFAALEGNTDLFRRSIISLSAATVVALLLSIFLGRITGFQYFGSEVLARTEPTLIDLGIAVVAGGLSGFSKVRQGINDAVAGTAIAVALMPPLCAVGLTLSQGIWSQSYGAFLLYFTNLLGITLACMIVFIVTGYSRVNLAFGWAIILTGILFFPLGLSLIRLIIQGQVEYNLTRIFTRNTLTGQRVELLDTDMIWTKQPASVYLKVRSEEPITPKQVRLVQEFLMERMGREFELIVLLDSVTEVRAEKLLEDLPEADNKSMKKQDINSEMKTIHLGKKKLLP
ncbi:DUF389 domain-containing protein [Limnoraphis robusta Tam1]|uniref:Membrane protein n=2 Tax=Limnoraphis robusta CS-951 TaxID=1637645 RepID=A0A0F5YJG1_9CYAN|nr:DUF389 domain-containing protein [Limnoraphis robusta]KKD38908.1 membrane protein [Limnoraphis robusta CS-951]MEA5541231.1 DUF389 domain-containing protein [Limnoraphis robusta Tam1]